MAPQYTDPMQIQVAEFHRVFGHPDGIDAPAQVSEKLGPIRVDMLRSEAIEEHLQAITLKDAAEVVDAIIDTNYFAYGTLVIMGYPVETIPLVERAEAATDLDSPEVLEALTRLVDWYDTQLDQLAADLQLPYTAPSAVTLVRIIQMGSNTLLKYGYDPTPFFDEVHTSNMSKLGADGKPILSRGYELDGAPEFKVIKGPDYFVADVVSIHERQRRAGGLDAIHGVDFIAAKRRAQVESKGYDAANDAQYTSGELVLAATAYLGAALGDVEESRAVWPFSPETFKPVETRLDLLTKAGALIAAEIDRHLAEDSSE